MTRITPSPRAYVTPLREADAPSMDAGDDPEPDLPREVERLRKAFLGLRNDMARHRIELQLLRNDLASIYGLLRLMHDDQQDGPQS